VRQASSSPRCSLRWSTPASIRAAAENGGDFTSPCSQTSGLSAFRTLRVHVGYDIRRNKSRPLARRFRYADAATQLRESLLQMTQEPSMNQLSRLSYAFGLTVLVSGIVFMVLPVFAPDVALAFVTEPYWVAIFVLAYLIAPVVSRYIKHR
jgi:hypothetical protein